MQPATIAGLGELIESYRRELLSEWHREVDLFRGAEQLDAPTITDHIPQLLTELAEHLRFQPKRSQSHRESRRARRPTMESRV
jgi:hypothetical protein